MANGIEEMENSLVLDVTGKGIVPFIKSAFVLYSTMNNFSILEGLQNPRKIFFYFGSSESIIF